MHDSITLTSDALIVYIMLILLLLISLWKLRDFYFKYNELRQIVYKDDDIKIYPEDAIPIKFRQHTFQIGNFLISITKATPRNLHNDMVNELGVVTFKKRIK